MTSKSQYVKSACLVLLITFNFNYEIGFGQCLIPFDFSSSADGTFESLSGVASNDAYNSNIYALGWFLASFSPSTPDSWVSPIPVTGSGLWAGLADGMPPSPDGGVFIGGWVNNSNNGETLTTRITNLEVGKAYVLKFYQANAGIDGITPIGTAQTARWRVTLNTQTFYSTAMDYKGEGNQIWMEEEMTFTSTTTALDLTFLVDSHGAGVNFEYMVLDGVRLFQYEDTDEDGIANCQDMDDDNDGILDEVECPAMNILSNQNADGTFESLSAVAGSDNPNGTVGVSFFVGLFNPGSGWAQGNGSPDSWVAPVPSTGSGILAASANGMAPSPDGGVFIGASVRNNFGESFFVRLDNLDVVRTYVLKFYQANAGIAGITPIDPTLKARWRIGDFLGAPISFSTAMDYKGVGNQIWMQQEMTFTATSPTKWLEFRADSDGTGMVYEYMAIDGISLYAQRLAGDVSDCSIDTDGDGIIDYVDIDSDNDNCPDALEGDGAFTRDNLDASNRLAGAVDTSPSSPTYGVPLVAISGQELGSSKDNTLRLGCPTRIVTNRGVTYRVKRD
ncbi:hypothetical protein [Flagellimonas sp. CMM7]|uniref:hypothetical protein n=1 Tax=Flagellimonas sp. CMM7 TaxID=2654676 RepID=UPI0013D0F6DE|nr:hypothetical protein [Flagellimonas sp. CMM7]UII78341.1 hypothetical protein LV704_11735 [Flagellimonas sp. CMM7]